MFTGIVECIGTVLDNNPYDDTESGGQGTTITIGNCECILSDCHIGDSIAVNGICLTVVAFETDTFKVGISPETIKRTNVASWTKGAKVNLERAVSQDVRFGGHYVQGHIDTVAKIVSREPEGNSIIFGFQLRDQEYFKYIVEKGFICIDGTSLTVTQVDELSQGGAFYISMIKHTQDNVIMPLKKNGDDVNIEVDLTGKIIEKQIVLTLENQISKKDSTLNTMIARIVEEKVKDYLSK
ncbi:rib5p [Saccharomyces arboricola H-6]|uniref:Riboflavin synthase n=1 Tax=Saccharomyces arboricola (strain H-6 / AS 2.3317 / CBS 10644) TaxID=1160507 RepID=J8PRF1_SACAR|nr:rib5p [Saccharomyces arboricola H-6]